MADLPTYKALTSHIPGWFAQRLELSLEEEESCLVHLVESGQLLEECGRYRRAPALNIDTRPDPEGANRPKR